MEGGTREAYLSRVPGEIHQNHEGVSGVSGAGQQKAERPRDDPDGLEDVPFSRLVTKQSSRRAERASANVVFVSRGRCL